MKLELPTPEEVAEIKKNNQDIIAKYFLLNREYLKRYVVSFCRRIHDFSEFDDYMSEIYLNFQKLSFENERFFGHDVFKVFCLYHYGDQRKRQQLKDGQVLREEYILDSPVKGLEKEGLTFGDILPDEKNCFEEPQPDISESLYNFLSGYLSKERKRVFEQFYWTGKTYKEVAQTLGKNARTVKRTREEIFKKFRRNKAEIHNFLVGVGYEIAV